MSAIIIDLSDPDQALIATDTLVVGKAGKPLGFTSKAFFVPSMRVVVAGTGIAGVLTSWLRCINEELCPTGIEGLNAETPHNLQSVFEGEFAWWKTRQDLHTSTIYHVGFSEVDGALRGFSYHSAEGFAPREIPCGVTCKPPVSAGYMAEEPVPRLIELMTKQHAAERIRSHDEGRVYIGGSVEAMLMTKTICSAFRIHEFEG